MIINNNETYFNVLRSNIEPYHILISMIMIAFHKLTQHYPNVKVCIRFWWNESKCANISRNFVVINCCRSNDIFDYMIIWSYDRWSFNRLYFAAVCYQPLMIACINLKLRVIWESFLGAKLSWIIESLDFITKKNRSLLSCWVAVWQWLKM